MLGFILGKINLSFYLWFISAFIADFRLLEIVRMPETIFLHPVFVVYFLIFFFFCLSISGGSCSSPAVRTKRLRDLNIVLV